jgi:3,4-dihydroxy-9,10-secoandrosta-1,3,5(10)-triene-9,17-dione 4,5-dioxygenase
MGMGHAVFSAPDFPATHAFYRDTIGFHDTDLPVFHLMGPDGPPMHFAFMHADNGRHHSLALGEGPAAPTGCVHLMLEMRDMMDVGKCYDRMRLAGVPESATLGRHTNDEMTSFYMQTPSGFDLEIGCDGLVIDPANWETTAHKTISEWGHVWAWQKAMEEAAAKQAQAAEAAE